MAVIGTLLALLVFFSLFGIFLTQYLPLWMEENENQFSVQMQVSLSELKSGVDDQYLLGGIPLYSVPFAMSSQSVPLLSQPTVASMSYVNGCPDGFYTANGTPLKIGACDFLRLNYSTAVGAANSQDHVYNQTVPTNFLQVSLPDRYYVPLSYFFENDGVVGEQDSGRNWMVIPPPFNVSKTPGNLTVVSSLLAFVGNTTSFTGQGAREVTSHLTNLPSNVSSTGRFLTAGGAHRAFNLTLTLGVHDVCAWYNYLYNETYHALGATSSTTWTLTGVKAGGTLTLPPTLSVCQTGLTQTYDLKLTIMNVNYAMTTIAQDQLTFNAGGL